MNEVIRLSSILHYHIYYLVLKLFKISYDNSTIIVIKIIRGKSVYIYIIFLQHFLLQRFYVLYMSVYFISCLLKHKKPTLFYYTIATTT